MKRLLPLVLSPRLNITLQSLEPVLPRLFSTAVPLESDVQKASVEAVVGSKRHLSQTLQLTEDDLTGSSFQVREGSPCIATQLDFMRYAIKKAASSLMTSHDVTDHNHFRHVYCKRLGITESLDFIGHATSEPSTTVTCSIHLSDDKKTKISLPWLPSNLTEKTVHKIISYILSDKPYTYYVYNIGNSVRVLVNSDVSLSIKIPPYLELLYPKSEEESNFVRVFVSQKRK